MRAVAAAGVGASRRFRDMPCCEPASTVTAAGIPHRPQPAVATGKTLPILSTTIYRWVYLSSPFCHYPFIYNELLISLCLFRSAPLLVCGFFIHFSFCMFKLCFRLVDRWRRLQLVVNPPRHLPCPVRWRMPRPARDPPPEPRKLNYDTISLCPNITELIH